MPGETPQESQQQMKPLGRDFDFSHLTDPNSIDTGSVEAAAVRVDPEAPSGQLDKSKGMLEDGVASLAGVANAQNTRVAPDGAESTNEAVTPATQDHNRRVVKMDIPESEWTPAMRRKAAHAAGNLVKDTYGVVPPNQLGRSVEG